MNRPKLIFGGGTIGESFSTSADVTALLESLETLEITHIDTAARYPPTAPGKSEQLLGEAGAVDHGFTVDTKINVLGDGRGSLSADAIDTSIKQSLQSLGVQKVNVLYCHTPDVETPIEETAAAFNRHYEQGIFTWLGVSNYSVEQLEEFLRVCQMRGYVKPSVYQGQYNVVWRQSEENLFPVLRRHGIRFNAYSPLAGGFLTGKLSAGGNLNGTRFEDGNMMGGMYRKLYDKPVMHSAIEKLQNIVQSHGITTVAASLRWLAFHSMLGKDDGIILGASKVAQIQGNAKDIEKGPLPEDVVKALEEIWGIVKETRTKL